MHISKGYFLEEYRYVRSVRTAFKGVVGMTVRETSNVLGIRLGSVYSLIWAGTLKASKTDGVWVIDRESVETYQAQRSARRLRIRRSRSSQRRTIDVQVVAEPEITAAKAGVQ